MINLPDFAYPFCLLLWIPLVICGFWYHKKVKETIAMRLPHLDGLDKLASPKMRWASYLWLMPWFATALSIVALARPQRSLRDDFDKEDGIDIVITIDLSLSMLAKDFEPNRLEVAKKVITTFVEKRKQDRFGLVTFSGEAFTQCPITSDRNMVMDYIKKIKYGFLDNGTAIGMGLATAINRIKDSPAKSKVVILLSDGENNTGYIEPLVAAEAAQKYGIRVYTIGIGSNGRAMTPTIYTNGQEPIYTMEDVKIDEAGLTRIADLSNGGRYFRAHNTEELDDIYNEIDNLEKTTFDTKILKHKVDIFQPWIFVAILLLFLYFMMRIFIFGGIPRRF